jgi:flagellar motor switch protein FliN/FliY
MTETDTTPAAGAQSLLQEYAAELSKAQAEPAQDADAVPEWPPAAPGAMAEDAPVGADNLDMIMRIPVTVKVVLGSAMMPVANLTKLGRGAVIALDRRVGEPVDVMVNGRVVARGEVVVVDESTSRFGISLTEIVGPAANEKGA